MLKIGAELPKLSPK